MPKTSNNEPHTPTRIPLQVKPCSHMEMPSVTSTLLGSQAGTVLHGHYSMDYQLPHGDRLRILARHNKKTAQLLLFTHDPDKLQFMPGLRPSSLVADTMNRIHAYRLRSDSYIRPKSSAQLTKYELASQCIDSLQPLLKRERELNCADIKGQEGLRRKVIATLEHCADQNRILAVMNPLISEGVLGETCNTTRNAIQHYAFNRIHPVSRLDQQHFNQDPSNKLCFVWDSEIHIGHDEAELANAIREICRQYHLLVPQVLCDRPANRFKRLEHFFQMHWHEAKEWANQRALPKKTPSSHQEQAQINGLTVTNIRPYYAFDGLEQKGFQSIDDLVLAFAGIEPLEVHLSNPGESGQVIVKTKSHSMTLNYFMHQGQYFPLPDGGDVLRLCQISKEHLLKSDRLRLQLKVLISSPPLFIKHYFLKTRHFLSHEVGHELMNHVHAGHQKHQPSLQTKPYTNTNRLSFRELLKNEGLLSHDQTLEQFIEKQLSDNHYVLARSEHPPSPVPYDNPFHNSFNLLRQITHFFINTSERNPIIGTLAIAAYTYGAGAVIAPNALSHLLRKLHLNGLIYGIEPSQALGRFMSNGTKSEAISAAITYWQGIVAGGNLDQFFIKSVETLKDNPAEIAIITALAMSMGYGLCEGIPALHKEMGTFPYTNYLAAGGKSTAAIYDTLMYPGEDWLFGTCKWLTKQSLFIFKCLICPFIEGFLYGRQEGFSLGWKKSVQLFKQTLKQCIAGSADFVLLFLTIPFLELGPLLLHLPFRGVTNLLSRTLSSLGHLGSIGQQLLNVSNELKEKRYLPGFRLSPLYGFYSTHTPIFQSRLLNMPAQALIRLCHLPLDLLKNGLLLPILDTSAFATRFLLELNKGFFYLVTRALGHLLSGTGQVSDPTVGLLCCAAAQGIVLTSNWIDRKGQDLRQWTLSSIQIARARLYLWAFSKEDKNLHFINQDKDYFLEQADRIGNFHHDERSCFLKTRLPRETTVNTTRTAIHPIQGPGFYSKTRSSKKTQPSQLQNEQSAININ